MHLFLRCLLLLTIGAVLACDRGSKEKQANVNINLPFGGGNGVSQAVGSFNCISILVRQSNDNSTAHCIDSGATEFAATQMIGPFTATSNVVSLTLPTGVTTFHLIAGSSSACLSNSSMVTSGLAQFLLTNQSFNLQSGTNNVNLTVTLASGNQIQNCQGVSNAN